MFKLNEFLEKLLEEQRNENQAEEYKSEIKKCMDNVKSIVQKKIKLLMEEYKGTKCLKKYDNIQIKRGGVVI